ncbi:leucine-rich repeat domain-containing protein [Sphingobacterium corticibacter]|uniref:TIR domain-containing protein n=1 Tax=Sphingobacterium corticibacter TaxID=2171749 RepID=A0A2T8HFT6_9SPHI|nr:leucine-rich repeat domain-containing protein [Sphingobacterium corticibacter]PVH24285.1 hypothetical protein DC487_14460 [Sphingobacterium corticibacter]
MKIPLNATKLDLSNMDLKRIPSDIFNCKNLRSLNLRNNQISHIPSEICHLRFLKSIDLSMNKITVLMAKFFDLIHLETLILNRNEIKSLPRQVGGLTKLKKLSLARNQLSILPDSLSSLTNLRSLDVSHNKLTKFPEFIELRNLKKLWLNGNPLEIFDVNASIYTQTAIQSVYCFSAMYNENKDVDNFYKSLRKIRGNCLSKIKQQQRQIEKQSEISDPMTRSEEKSIFISYSHDDKKWLDFVIKELRVLQYENLKINPWVDTQLKAGDDWDQKIKLQLNDADIVIILVSSSFLASEYVMNDELPQIIQGIQSKGTQIIPIIVRKCRYKQSALGKFQALNDPESPLNKLQDYQVDKLLHDLSSQVESLVKNR